MICAGTGARVIANIWNGSLDKRNICTMPCEKQREEETKGAKNPKKIRVWDRVKKIKETQQEVVHHVSVLYVESLNVHAAGQR